MIRDLLLGWWTRSSGGGGVNGRKGKAVGTPAPAGISGDGQGRLGNIARAMHDAVCTCPDNVYCGPSVAEYVAAINALDVLRNAS